MATAKKSTAKKAPVSKKVTASSTVVKTPAKKTTKKSAAAKVPGLKSFKLSPDSAPFLSTRITRQTIYWVILLLFIMAMALWVLNIQIQIIEITDSVLAEY